MVDTNATTMTIRREFANPTQQLTTFLKLIGITANLTEMFDQAIGHEAWKSADVVEAPPKTRGVLIQRDYNDGTRLSSMVNLRSELYLESKKKMEHRGPGLGNTTSAGATPNWRT